MNLQKNAEKLNKEVIARLRNYVFKKVYDSNEAEEVFQEVLVAATDSLPLFRGESLFFTWLCGIANHEIADFYRKKKLKTVLFSRFPFLETIASEALTPDEELEKKELVREVKKVLGALTEGYRAILRQKYIDGMTVNQIAGKMGKSIKSIESRLTRARESFKKIWLTKLKVKNLK